MYTLSKNLKLSAIIFMVVGALLFAVDAMFMPSSISDIEAMHAGDDHGTGHEVAEVNDSHGSIATAKGHSEDHAVASHQAEEGHAMSEAEHNQHLLDGYKNKPWSAVYVAAFFFFMISLGCLAFYAVQYAAQAGWSPLLLRVMEAITGYLLPGSIIMLILLALSGFHFNHIFHWMADGITDPTSENYDKLIAGKSGLVKCSMVID